MIQDTITMQLISTNIPQADQITLYQSASTQAALEKGGLATQLDYAIVSVTATIFDATTMSVQIVAQPGANMLVQWPTEALRVRVFTGLFRNILAAIGLTMTIDESIVETP